MENFELYIGTKIFFGQGQIDKLSENIAFYGKNVLFVYGGGSIKKLGLYDKVLKQLEGLNVFELRGVEANPKITSVYQGVKLCRDHNVDVILAVGGGSVIDCSKVIAAAVYYEGDAWDMVRTRSPIKKALPLCTVSTLAATGSEMDAGAVVVNSQTNEKISVFSHEIVPKVSIIDPSYTFTVSAEQTAAGCADIMSHLLEQYFVPKSTFMADLLVESVMKTVIHYADTAIKEPNNYEARAQIMCASEMADNSILSNGNQMAVFGVHGMEHQLSGRFNTTHGVGLAILTPRWMKYVLSETTVGRFAHYGTAVWGIDENLDRYEIAKKAIEATAGFFKGLDIPQTLTEIGVNPEQFEEMAKKAEEYGTAHAWVPLYAKDIAEIYRMSL